MIDAEEELLLGTRSPPRVLAAAVGQGSCQQAGVQRDGLRRAQQCVSAFGMALPDRPTWCRRRCRLFRCPCIPGGRPVVAGGTCAFRRTRRWWRGKAWTLRPGPAPADAAGVDSVGDLKLWPWLAGMETMVLLRATSSEYRRHLIGLGAGGGWRLFEGPRWREATTLGDAGRVIGSLMGAMIGIDAPP